MNIAMNKFFSDLAGFRSAWYGHAVTLIDGTKKPVSRISAADLRRVDFIQARDGQKYIALDLS